MPTDDYDGLLITLLKQVDEITMFKSNCDLFFERPNFKSNSSSTYLDIEQDELSEVMNARKQSHATSNPSFRLNHNNPLMWIGHITQSVLEDVVMKVCEELVSVDNVLAANILDIELLR